MLSFIWRGRASSARRWPAPGSVSRGLALRIEQVGAQSPWPRRYDTVPPFWEGVLSSETPRVRGHLWNLQSLRDVVDLL